MPLASMSKVTSIWGTPRGAGGIPTRSNLPQRPVLGRHLALPLEHVDGDGRLAVRRGGEGLALAGGYGGVAVYELCEHAPEGLDAQRERRDIQQEHVLDLAAQDAALDGGAHGNHLVGVHPLAPLLAEDVAHEGLDGGDPGGAAHEDDMVDVLRSQPGVAEGLEAGSARLLEQVLQELLQARAGKGLVHVTRARLVRGDERQVEGGGLRAGKLYLGLLRRLLQPLQRHAVLQQVDARFLAELGRQPLDDALVEIVTAEMGVAVGGLHLEDAVAELQDGDVEGPAAQVVDGDGLLAAALVQAIGQRRRGGLVDDPLHVEAGNPPGVLGGLPLCVVEVRGDGDDRVRHRLAEVVLGGLLHLLQDGRGNLRRRVQRAADLHAHVVARLRDLEGDALRLLPHLVETAAHEPLDGVHGVLGVGDHLVLGRLAHQALVAVRVGHDGRRGPLALGVLDDNGLAAFHDGHAGVRCSQVDADDLTHRWLPSGQCPAAAP